MTSHLRPPLSNCLALAMAVLAMGPAHASYYDAEEKQTLLDFYNTIGGPGWIAKVGWSSPSGPYDSPCDGWTGVHCTDGKVTALSLPNNNLVGEVSRNLSGKLSQLRDLNLNNNKLYGILPNIDGTRVISFQAANNQFVGFISRMDATSLESLVLDQNWLTSTIPLLPATIAQISLTGNNLGGTLPDFSGFAHLDMLQLENNQFVGLMPYAPPVALQNSKRATLCGRNRLWASNDLNVNAGWNLATNSSSNWYQACGDNGFFTVYASAEPPDAATVESNTETDTFAANTRAQYRVRPAQGQVLDRVDGDCAGPGEWNPWTAPDGTRYYRTAYQGDDSCTLTFHFRIAASSVPTAGTWTLALLALGAAALGATRLRRLATSSTGVHPH